MEYRIEIAIDQHNGHNLWFKSIFSRDAKRANTVRAMTTGRIYSMIDEIIASGTSPPITINAHSTGSR